MSKLYFKYGAMNCGKTTILIQTAYNYEQQNMKVIVIKPKVDKKGENFIVSRVGIKRKVDHLVSDTDNIYELIKNKYNNITCLLVDEAQFLTSTQIDQLQLIAATLNIVVICYGLRCDFRQQGFEGSTRLLQIADKLEEIKTICKCGKKATTNVRKLNGNYVFEGNQIGIDGMGSVTYESMCPSCYIKLKNNNV